MTIYKEDKSITVSTYDLNSLLFVETIEEYQVEVGFGLPSGYTEQICPNVEGMVGKWSPETEEWRMTTDDRGRVFYNKFNGARYETQFVGEIIDRTQFTAIPAPSIDIEQICYFDTSKQQWVVGLDWYEKEIWDSYQEKSYCTEQFFVPNAYSTNIEPTEEQAGYLLNEHGEWVEPEPEPEVEVEVEVEPEVEEVLEVEEEPVEEVEEEEVVDEVELDVIGE